MAGQSLSDPGSCWREFYVNNMMECRQSFCTNTKAEYSFWLSTAIEDQMTHEDYPQSTSYAEDPELVKRYIRFELYKIHAR